METYTLIPTFSLREKGLMSSLLRERIQARVKRFHRSIVDTVLGRCAVGAVRHYDDYGATLVYHGLVVFVPVGVLA